MLEKLKEWGENYRKVLKCDEDTEGVASALGMHKMWDAYLHALPKPQQKVLRLRYLEGASWEGIGQLLGMDARWAKWTAAEGIANLERLLELKKKHDHPENTRPTRARGRTG